MQFVDSREPQTFNFRHFTILKIKVLWLGEEDVKVTWEPASCLPESLIKAFHNGEQHKAVEHKIKQHCKKAYSLFVESFNVESLPNKKTHLDRPVVDSNDGLYNLLHI